MTMIDIITAVEMISIEDIIDIGAEVESEAEAGVGAGKEVEIEVKVEVGAGKEVKGVEV